MERKRAVGVAVAAKIVEGLRSIVEGLCRIVEGLCLDGKVAKLLILIGPVGFSFAKPREKLPVVRKNPTYCANGGTGRIAASITILSFSAEIQSLRV